MFLETPICFPFVTADFRFAHIVSLTNVGLPVTVDEECCVAQKRNSPV